MYYNNHIITNNSNFRNSLRHHTKNIPEQIFIDELLTKDYAIIRNIIHNYV